MSKSGRKEVQELIARLVKTQVDGLTPIKFHPDDRADDGEVMVATLQGVDQHFQAKASWSLERTVAEVRANGIPASLDAKQIDTGNWSFYALRTKVGIRDVVIIRARSPSFGLTSSNKLVTAFVGTELKPVDEPLVAFDYAADVVVVDKKVHIINPDRTERLFVDAEAVKARAPLTAQDFASDLGAPLSAPTAVAIERVCSKNAHTARRVERLIAEGDLPKIKASDLRHALPDAGLTTDSFGKSGALKAQSDLLATILIELSADLYYQPRFAAPSRRVGNYRQVKR